MTEPTVELEAGDTVAAVIPSVGGRLGRLDLGTGPVLRPRAPGLGWADWGCYPLVPWSNRIPGGRLRLAGTEHRLPVTWPDGSAIHGLGATVPWEVVGSTTTTADLALDIAAGPWRLAARLTYGVAPGRLRCRLEARNLADHPVPVGLGIHPWFPAGAVRVPAARKWPGDPLPVGPPVPVGPDDDLRRPRVPPVMDRCFTDLEGDAVDVGGVRLSWRGPVTHVVVYTGQPGWVAVEPVTMANDAFGLAARGVPGHGLIDLGPGDRVGVEWTFTLIDGR